MDREQIRTELFKMQDKKYAAFQAGLMPNINADTVIGVRTPDLRRFAKTLYKEGGAEDFLLGLPHHYFEENQLHAFLISLEKDFEPCMAKTEAFLPYIDNWASCDQLSPQAFKKEPERLLPYIYKWLGSDHTYTVRFAVGMLMRYFLDERFRIEYADMAARIRSEEYYIKMMVAWYFATALAKQYDKVLPFLEEKRLDAWIHNKTIQKSIESRRIGDGQKEYLRTLKVKRM